MSESAMVTAAGSQSHRRSDVGMARAREPCARAATTIRGFRDAWTVGHAGKEPPGCPLRRGGVGVLKARVGLDSPVRLQRSSLSL